MVDVLDRLMSDLGGMLPQLFGALAVLVVGWILAAVVARIVRTGLRKTGLDARIASLTTRSETPAEAGKWISHVVFALLMLMVAIGVFQALHLTLVTTPLSSLLDQVFAFLPRLAGAAILFGLAWAIAAVLKRVVRGSLVAMNVDGKLATASSSGTPILISTSIAETVYWFVFLLFVPAILGALELRGLLAPVQNMLDVILRFVPNLLAAAVIGLVGWFVAKIARRIVTSLLAAAGVDRANERIGLAVRPGGPRISEILGLACYVLILVPVLISSLNALRLSAVTEPATRMLAISFELVPSLVGAALVLLLAYVIGRVLAGLATNVLKAAGFDGVLAKLGFAKPSSALVTSGDRSLSVLAGRLVLATVMIFALIEASSILGFEALTDLTVQVLVMGSRILFGVVIFAVGFWLAGVASRAVRARSGSSVILGRVTWGAIVLLSAAMGLRRMGLADDIINLAFGLLLGAVAVAAAIAFGIGGRDVAARTMEKWAGRSGRGPTVRVPEPVK